MSFLGFDLGNATCVVAVARPRITHIDVDVLLNEVSKRETPAFISFDGKQRLFGAAAATKLKNTVSQIKRLLALTFSDPELHNDLKSLPFKVTEAKNGSPLVQVENHEPFTPTQLLGMLLAHLKKTAESSLRDLHGEPVQVDACCIGVPAYFSDAHRNAVVEAAKIARLNSVTLLQETTAAVLDFMTVQTKLHKSSPTNVAFVDVGHASTQVCIAGLKKGEISILSRASDRSLGGRDFDDILFHLFADRFMNQHKIDVRSSEKASVKLRLACQKTKTVLTSNPEASISVDSIIGGLNLVGSIKREEFEQMSGGLLERLKAPVVAALSDAKLSVNKIQSFVLVGAGSRVPAIVAVLKDFFGGKEPKRTIIASECIARGCALQCAFLGSNSDVPRILIKETDAPVENGYGGMVSEDLQRAIDREEALALQDRLVEETEEMKNAVESYVYDTRDKFDGKYREFVADSEKEEIIEKLQEVEDWLGEDEDATKDVYSGKLNEMKKQSYPIEERYTESVDRVPAIDQLVRCIISFKEGAWLKDPKFDHIDVVEKEKVIEECKKTYGWLVDKRQKQDALPKYSTPTLRSADLKREAEALDRFCWPIINKPSPSLDDKKKPLDEYAYNMTCKYQKYVIDSDKDFINHLKEVKLWLYEDVTDGSKASYDTKLDNIKKHGDHIEKRYKEIIELDTAFTKLTDCINRYKVDALSNDPIFDHIAIADKEKVINECDKADAWLVDQRQKQDAFPKYSTAILHSSDLKREAEALDGFCWPIINKPSPSLNDKKKALDEYIYNMICKLNGDYQEYVTDSEKNEFITNLKKVKVWLHKDGTNEPKAIYDIKFDEIKKHGDPIEKRYKDSVELNAAFTKLADYINLFKVDTLSNDPKFGHVPIADKEKVLNECDEANVWLVEKKQQQESLAKHANYPVPLSADVYKRAEALYSFCCPIINQPVPRPPVWKNFLDYFTRIFRR